MGSADAKGEPDACVGEVNDIGLDMSQDLDAGRLLERDAWSSSAVMIGKELGIPTPVNFAMYAGLKPYENGGLVGSQR